MKWRYQARNFLIKTDLTASHVLKKGKTSKPMPSAPYARSSSVQHVQMNTARLRLRRDIPSWTRKNMPTSMTDKVNEENNNVLCNIHPTEFIKYFCHAHETVNFGHCVVIEHPSCKLSFISEISDSFKNGPDYRDIKSSISKLLKDVNDSISDVESNIKTVLKIGEDEIQKLKDYREKVNNYFDERDKSLLEIIERMKDMDKTRLDSLIPKCDTIKTELGGMKVKLELQEGNNSVNLFIEAKKVRKEVGCLEEALNDINKENIVQRYEFIEDTATENLIAGSSGLGIVRNVQSSGQQTVPIDLASLNFIKAESIPVKSSTDTADCMLTGMLLLPEDRLLLADHKNSTVQLMELQTCSMVSRIKLPGAPWSMCVLPADRVAVCLYDKSSVVFLDTRGQISVGTSIKVEEDCYDIAYYTDELFVTFENGKVVKMDIRGKTIKKIDKSNRQALFSSCLYLTLMDDGQRAAIFVADNIKHTIIKLDMDLNILQTFNDPAMQQPTGLTAVGNQLLISCYDTHTILRLDLSSGKMFELLGESGGIKHQYKAVYSPEQNKLYIINKGSGQDDLSNYLHVYKSL